MKGSVYRALAASAHWPSIEPRRRLIDADLCKLAILDVERILDVWGVCQLADPKARQL